VQRHSESVGDRLGRIKAGDYRTGIERPIVIVHRYDPDGLLGSVVFHVVHCDPLGEADMDCFGYRCDYPTSLGVIPHPARCTE
jgi:hypothetical protein